MTDLLQSVLDRETVAALKQSADGLQRVTQVLSANSEKLGAVIANAERSSGQLEPLLRSGNEAMRALRNEVLPEAHRTLARLDNLTSTQVEPLLQSSHEAVQALQTQILPEAYRTLAKVDKLSTSLADMTATIRRDPSVLVRGSPPPPPGPGEDR
jgi:hypothetical protein